MPRIVKLADLNKKERKKIQEQTKNEVEERKSNIQNQISFKDNNRLPINNSQNNFQLPVNNRVQNYSTTSKFPITNNINRNNVGQEQKNTSQKVFEALNPGKKINYDKDSKSEIHIGGMLPYIAKNYKQGLLEGTAGIAQGQILSASNEAKKISEQSNKDKFKNLNETFFRTLNPIYGIAKNSFEMGQNTLNTLKDKDKTAKQKVAEILTNSVSGVKDLNNPIGDVVKLSGKTAGIINNKAGDKLLELNEKIDKPLRENREKLQEEGQNYSNAVRMAGTVSNVVGNMTPSIVASRLGGGNEALSQALSLGTMGLSVKGRATQEALSKGAELDKAIKIGDTKAMTEVGTELLTGGLNIFGKGALDDIVKRGINRKVESKVLNYLAKQGAGIAGEVGEETISDILDTVIDQGTVDPKATYSMKDWSDTALTTMLSTVVLNALGGAYTPRAYNQNVQEMEQYKAKQDITERINNSNLSEEDKSNMLDYVENEDFTQADYNAMRETIENSEQPTDIISQEQISSLVARIDKSNLPNEDKLMMKDYIQNNNVSQSDINSMNNVIDSAVSIPANNELVTNQNFKDNVEARKKYSKYKNDTGEYNSKAIDEVLDLIPENRNGNRTVKQWLQVAKETGTRIADLSNEEIERIAYKSWFDVQPSKNITKYDRQTKSTVGFQKLTSDEWINTINKAVNEARENNQNISKDINQVQQEVSNYLKKNNINMSVDQFMEWASTKELEQENNMSREQQELYSLISDIQNRSNLNKLEKSNKIEYNKTNLDLSEAKPGDLKNQFYKALTPKQWAKYHKKMNSVMDTTYGYFDRTDVIDGKVVTTQLIDGNEQVTSVLKIKKNPQRLISFVKELSEKYGYNGAEVENSLREMYGEENVFRYDTSSNKFIPSTTNTDITDRGINTTSTTNERITTKKENITTNKGEIESQQGSFNLSQDNQGRTLNKQQQEFFKDSKARNENGNLLEVYQGTPTGGFTIYDTSKLGKTTGAKDATLGIHFTDNLDMANTFKDYVTDEIYEQSKKEIYKKYDIKENEIIPFDMKSKINKEIDSLAEAKVKETGEVKKQYLNIKKPMSIFADYGISEEQLANDLVYALTGSYDITETTDYYDNNQDLLLTLQQNFNNELGEMKDDLAKPECVNRLKELGYDGVILPLQSTDKVGLAQLGMNTKGNEYIVFDSNQAKNIDNKNPTLNPDIRYELEDTSNNTAENEIQRKINRSMTMDKAKDMVQRAFITGNIYDWFNGEYKNGDEWLAGEGADAVALIIDNDFNLQQKYVNSNNDILNEEYLIEDVIQAYQDGTLTGSSDNQTKRLDVSKSNNYEDTRFYAPKDIQGGKELYEIANQRVTNANRQEVYKARANFIINAHNDGYIESLGLNPTEVNGKLRSWTSYPQNALQTSMNINKGVAKENRWTGIENCSIVNELSVNQEQLNSMVKEIKGDTNEWQRRYISNTMLAIDTHMNYKNLTFDFAPDAQNMKDNVLGDYTADYDIIRVKRDGQNTVSHEMGHYIDHLIGRELADGYNLGVTRLCRSNLDNWSNGKTFTVEQKQFLNNFSNFLEDIENSSDIGSSYKMSSDEVFARFVARFTEWTRNTATGNRYGYEAKWYNDNFNNYQYKEFAKLLQEYSLLKTTGQADGRSTTLASQRTGKVKEQKIEDIYSELFKEKEDIISEKSSMPMNEKQEQEKVAQILEKPQQQVKEKDRTWAILKAGLLDKGIVFEELSHKTKNRELQSKWDYTLSATARGQNAIGNARYEFDPKTKKQKQISKSLEDIRAEVGDRISDFNQYMYHLLNIDRMTLEERFGGDTGTNFENNGNITNKPVFSKDITADISRGIVEKLENKHSDFKNIAQDVYNYNNANKQELVRNGVISQELSDKLAEMYPHYVPIKRVDAKGSAIKVPLDTNRTGINSPLARATGGNSDIQPLFETMADRTMQTYRAGARNNFGVELLNTLNSQIESNNVDVDTIIDEIGSEDTELLKEGKNGENPTFTVFNNGEKTTFEITKDMYDALKPISDGSLLNKKILKGIPNKISNLRRGVLTEYNPLFSITNALKDAQDVIVNSQHTAKTFSKFPEAYSQILKKGYWFKEYVQNGGEQNSYFKDGEFTSDKKVPIAKKALSVPLNAISNVNNVIEMAPRLAEYIASREAGRSVETSMLDASRVTTNFKAGGDITKFANRNGATFLNASVQGFQQQIRNIKEANVKGLKGYAVLAGKYTVAGVIPAIINSLIWKDDKDYEDLQDYVKDNYYCIAKLGDGKFIRIPKGRMVASLQKIVSNIGEYMTDDKKLNIDNFAKDFWEDLKFEMDNVAPNNPLDNNVISPVIQAISNKSWYGEDIVPSRLQKKPDAQQYDETTDSLSKWLGEKLNKSPYKINYLLDQYSGGVGDIVLPMMTKQAENNAIEDKFTTDSVMKSKYPGKFFELKDQLETNNVSDYATDEDKLKYKYINEISSELSDLYNKKREIQNSNMSDKDKKAKLKEVQKDINIIAKDGIDNVGKIKADKNTATIDDKQYYKYKNEWTELSDKDKEKTKNISLSTFADYRNKVYELTKQKKESEENIKSEDKIQLLLDSKYSNKDKEELYKNYIGSNDSIFNTIKSSGINIDEYLKYKTQNFESDKKNDGTIKGESKRNRKDKVVKYLNSMDIKGNQRLLLYASQGYATSKEQKNQLVKYVNSLNLDNKEKLELFNKFSGFEVYKNGKITY